ncbi:MAG: DoxX-like family protein [Polaromonas sp.]|nr:DoxX-like family protein [Polaromonas sp.]
MPHQPLSLHERELRLLRWSLVAVWLATAAVSVWELEGQSAGLLRAAGITDPALSRGLVLLGAAVDAILGLALLLRARRLVYLLALAAMLLMTAVATVLDPSLWLHPLGPLTKNLPMAAVLLLLAKVRA